MTREITVGQQVRSERTGQLARVVGRDERGWLRVVTLDFGWHLNWPENSIMPVAS